MIFEPLLEAIELRPHLAQQRALHLDAEVLKRGAQAPQSDHELVRVFGCLVQTVFPGHLPVLLHELGEIAIAHG
ncbi:hypothetical protein D3C87_1628670 [compost metagenome]